jgi:hypothetical protein
MDFLKFYPKGRNLIIEIITDKYVCWQPTIEDEITSKIDEISPIVAELLQYCKTNNMNEIILLDFDKAIQFDKINYILLCKIIKILTDKFVDDEKTLKKVELRRCNETIVKIFNTMKGALPNSIVKILEVYSI